MEMGPSTVVIMEVEIYNCSYLGIGFTWSILSADFRGQAWRRALVYPTGTGQTGLAKNYCKSLCWLLRSVIGWMEQ